MPHCNVEVISHSQHFGCGGREGVFNDVSRHLVFYTPTGRGNLIKEPGKPL
jgi:hypothetical protein